MYFKNVTGFAKILHVCTRFETNFIACYKRHTLALSKHNNKSSLDKQDYFYRQPVVDPVKSGKTIIDLVRPLRALIGYLVV